VNQSVLDPLRHCFTAVYCCSHVLLFPYSQPFGYAPLHFCYLLLLWLLLLSTCIKEHLIMCLDHRQTGNT